MNRAAQTWRLCTGLALFVSMASFSNSAVAEETVRKYSDVEVILGHPLTSNKYRTRVERYKGQESLKTQLLNELKKRDLYDKKSDRKLTLKLIRFRLKSPASTILLFYHSGRNRIVADVSITEHDKTVASFRQKISHMPHPFAPGRGHSLKKMVRVFSARLAKRLERKNVQHPGVKTERIRKNKGAQHI